MKHSRWCLSLTGCTQSSSEWLQASGSEKKKTPQTGQNHQPLEESFRQPWEGGGAYDERLLVDVVQVQREDVVLAAHVHAVVVLVHQQDAVVGGVEQEGEVVSRAGGLQLC